MNERSFIVHLPPPPLMSNTLKDNGQDRRAQILDAAIACFARQGFHPTSMHDISAEAGISVGLIYRYFENKEAVITAMAERHKNQLHDLLQQAAQAPSLLESLEILFTAHCCEEPKLQSAFVVDLYAEASRNPDTAELVLDVVNTAMSGVTDLIARSPEGQTAASGLSPEQISELIFAVARGMLMRDVLHPAEMTAAERRDRQLAVARRLWRLLFETAPVPSYA